MAADRRGAGYRIRPRYRQLISALRLVEPKAGSEVGLCSSASMPG
jgi:hypothetical protein